MVVRTSCFSWNTENGNKFKSYKWNREMNSALAFSPDGKNYLSAAAFSSGANFAISKERQENYKFWNAVTGKTIRYFDFSGLTGFKTEFTISRDGSNDHGW